MSQSRYIKTLRRDPCAYCGNLGGTLDHILPRSRGGAPFDWANLTGACLTCNGRKGAKPLLFYLLERTGSIVDWRAYWADKMKHVT